MICSECGHVADNTEMMRAHMWTHIGSAAAEVVITVGWAWVETRSSKCRLLYPWREQVPTVCMCSCITLAQVLLCFKSNVCSLCVLFGCTLSNACYRHILLVLIPLILLTFFFLLTFYYFCFSNASAVCW